MASPRLRRVAGVMVAAAVGGAACDQIHVRGGVLSYARPRAFDQAWWVAPQFGLAVGAMVVGALPLARSAAKGAPDRPSPARIVGETAWFLGAYAASGLGGNRFGRHLAAALGVTWLARLAVRGDRRIMMMSGVALATAGVAYEGTLAGTGAFTYRHPDLYRVPIWLPGIYLHGAPLLVNVTRLLLVDSEPAPVAWSTTESPS